jgi:hypothetical protein
MTKYWEIIANNLSAAGWTWGVVSAVNTDGKTVFVADAHRSDGKRFIVRADELLTAFVELERAIGLCADKQAKNEPLKLHCPPVPTALQSQILFPRNHL